MSSAGEQGGQSQPPRRTAPSWLSQAPVEVATVTVVQFLDGKMASERIYWDQASVLARRTRKTSRRRSSNRTEGAGPPIAFE